MEMRCGALLTANQETVKKLHDISCRARKLEVLLSLISSCALYGLFHLHSHHGSFRSFSAAPRKGGLVWVQPRTVRISGGTILSRALTSPLPEDGQAGYRQLCYRRQGYVPRDKPEVADEIHHGWSRLPIGYREGRCGLSCRRVFTGKGLAVLVG